MRTSRLLFCLSALLLGPVVGKGQSAPPRYSVHFHAHSGVSGSDFRVELTRRTTVVSLRYGRLDSIQHKAMRRDPRFAAYVSAIEAPQRRAAEKSGTLQLMAALWEQYTVYRWDSLEVATTEHPALVQALDSVYKSPAAQLERADENRNRIVLDGTSVQVVVKSGPQTAKNLYVQSPTPTSHPQLYRLLHAALDLYRQQQPAAILDQRYTNGY